MLKVTSKREDSVEVLELEGKLSGDWVWELERYWKGRTPEPGIALHLHLKAVTYIDAAGKQLLTEMYRNGVEIKGCGCMTRAVVDEIVRGAGAHGLAIPIKRILALVMLGVCIFGGI
jgi:hypothetical protein